MTVIQTARRILKLTEREVKALEKKQSKARDAWLKAMHLAEAKASILNGIQNQLEVAQEKLKDYEEEVKYYDKHGARPVESKKSKRPKLAEGTSAVNTALRRAAITGESLAVSKKTSKKKATKKVAKKATKKASKRR
jgi:gamma-glutamyltranspeptidase